MRIMFGCALGRSFFSFSLRFSLSLSLSPWKVEKDGYREKNTAALKKKWSRIKEDIVNGHTEGSVEQR